MKSSSADLFKISLADRRMHVFERCCSDRNSWSEAVSGMRMLSRSSTVCASIIPSQTSPMVVDIARPQEGLSLLVSI